MSGTIADVVLTLCAADSLAWQNLYRRSRLLPSWTRRKRREIESEHEQRGIMVEALPFALNQPTAPFMSCPGVHSEWLTFQLTILVANGGRYTDASALAAWQDLARRREELRLSVGQHAALRNIAAGIDPPTSGHDNPHYFDDSACFRAVALLAAVEGDVLESVSVDASISNAEDGVWCARALVAALRAAMAGAGVAESVASAREQLPVGSWSRHELDRALSIAARSQGLLALIDSLANEVANHAYDYGNTAPEVLALGLAIISFTGGALEPSLLAALGLPRTAASVAPLVGALSGALVGAPDGARQGPHAVVTEPTPLSGLALPHLAGLHPLTLLAQLAGEPASAP